MTNSIMVLFLLLLQGAEALVGVHVLSPRHITVGTNGTAACAQLKNASLLLSSSSEPGEARPFAGVSFASRAAALVPQGWPYPSVPECWAALQLPAASLPLQDGVRYTVRDAASDELSWSFTFAPSNQWTPALRVNQVGYSTRTTRFAFVSAWLGELPALELEKGETSFELRSAADDSVVFAGNLTLRLAWNEGTDDSYGNNYAKANVYEADFSAASIPDGGGEFYVAWIGVGRSDSFTVSSGGYNLPFQTAFRALYQQRCGTALEETFTQWPHGKCHDFPAWKTTADRNVVGSDAFSALAAASTGVSVQATGGYHDAGDYDRGIQHLAVVDALVELYEFDPDKFSSDNFNIPESGNGIPDVLDETRWAISLYLALQESDGGVSSGLETTGYPGWEEMPENDTHTTWYAYAKEPISSLKLAGAAAKMSRVWASWDSEFAANLLERAELAFNYAETNCPNYTAKSCAGSIAYAAAELLKATGNAKYDAAFRSNCIFNISGLSYSPKDWDDPDVVPLYIYSTCPGADSTYKNASRNLIISWANRLIAHAEKSGFRRFKQSFMGVGFGSLSTPLKASVLFSAYALTGDSTYMNWLASLADITLGCNEEGVSYMTGMGEHSVRFPLHTPSIADGIADPVPGIVVYGPNKATSSSGILGAALAAVYPAVGSWPLGNRFADVSYVPVYNEFTVTESIAPSLLAFGMLSDGDFGDASPSGDGRLPSSDDVNAATLSGRPATTTLAFFLLATSIFCCVGKLGRFSFVLLVVVSLIAGSWAAVPVDVGNGFFDHGVAVDRANARGIVATACGAEGFDCALIWLMDYAGGFGIVAVDASTGESRTVPVPVSLGGDSPFASLLSADHRFYYAHVGSVFLQFDAVALNFSFWERTLQGTAMSMTLGDDGTVWSATYPKSGLVSFNPSTRTLTDHGFLHNESWAQYQRTSATDDAGWVYFAVGNTESQIIAFNPATGTVREMIAAAERQQGTASVYRYTDGKVYGCNADGTSIYQLYTGSGVPVSAWPSGSVKRVSYITGSQGLFYKSLPSGRTITAVDTVAKTMTVKNATGSSVVLDFTYSCGGAHIMDISASPDGRSIWGGTAFPMMFFLLNTRDPSGKFVNENAYHQFNTVGTQGDFGIVGSYPYGSVLVWNPSRPWVDTSPSNNNSNPLWLVDGKPNLIRPTSILAHPDGRTLVLSGTPAYGTTGGGLVFVDRITRESQIVPHTELLQWHSVESLVSLHGSELLFGGTTIAPGTGGATIATVAELFLLNMTTKRIVWHEAVFPDITYYLDLWPMRSGYVLGIAERTKFFVFDPANRTVVHEETISSVSSQQGPRVFVPHPTDPDIVYIAHSWCISQVNPHNFTLTRLTSSSIGIYGGVLLRDGNFFFTHSSRIYSKRLFNGTFGDETSGDLSSADDVSASSVVVQSMMLLLLLVAIVAA